MAEIVNLRQARKAKKRAENAVQAQANRARHGSTKAERLKFQQEADRLSRTLDGARLDDASNESE
ncbi:DUF4169 family protein [Novosphingobium sp. M1R2S20]|uniref:DUF4169 family protein n=1 Tax=Novosphingobium rhizovicinum TaxID=3228928 RepID=A0ABV3RDJ1_9SPHN